MAALRNRGLAPATRSTHVRSRHYIPPGNLRIAVFFYAEKLCSNPAPIWRWRGNPAFLLPVQWQANN